MITLLSKIFIKDNKNYKDPTIRRSYGILCSVTGIAFNVILFIAKFILGLVTCSLAIQADSFNNLSDAGSSILSLLGFRFSSRKPTDANPFGSGRIEYISSLVISVIVMTMGISVLRDSIIGIVEKSTSSFSIVAVSVLSCSIVVKAYMACYNTVIGKKIDSSAMRAVASDSLGDVVATFAVLVSMLIYRFTGFDPDNYCGILVSVFILWSGFSSAKDTVSTLLGKRPDKELVNKICSIVLGFDGIIGVHDLVVHDYGPGRVIASAHAEVKDTENIVEIHEIIDALENKIEEELGVVMIIHTDPINVDCERTISFKNKVEEIAEEIDKNLTIHDFRITDGKDNINLIFDIVFPYEYDDKSCHKIVFEIMDKMKSYDSRINIVAKIDRTY